MSNSKELRNGLLTDIKKEVISEYLTSGCTLIDLCVGGGAGMGFKKGTFIRISGVNSSGKTFLISEIAAQVYHKYKDLANISIQDCEARNTIDTEYLYGIPRSEIISENPPITIEQLDADLGLWLKNLKKKEEGIYAVDSMESLTNADIADKGTMGMHTAKFYSQEFFRTKKGPLSEKGATCFLLSQMRENVDRKNPYSPKYKTTGGPGIAHWVDCAIELKVVQKLGTKERPIGVVVELSTTKLTAPRPFRKCRYTLYFTMGIDNIGSNLDYLFELRGDDGKMRETQAGCIAWSGVKINTKILKEWIEAFDEKHDTHLLKEAKKAFKEAEGRAVLSVDFHQKWLREHESPEITKAFCKDFGNGDSETYTREELIAAIEKDESGKMERELEQRVIDKWESIETEAVAELSTRKRRH